MIVMVWKRIDKYHWDIYNRVDFNKYRGLICRGVVNIRSNGPNTAYAYIDMYMHSYEDDKVKIRNAHLYSHFKGKNAAHRAKGWVAWLLKNPPWGFSDWHNLETVPKWLKDYGRNLCDEGKEDVL